MYKRFMAVLFASVILTAAFAGLIHAEAEGAPTRAVDRLNEIKAAITAFNTEYEEFVNALIEQQKSTYELVGVISDDFNHTLTSPGELNNSDVLAFYDRLIELYPKYLDTYLQGYEMTEQWSVIQGTVLSDSDTRLFFTAAALVVGLGCLAYSGYKAVKNAFNKNADASKGIIDAASPSDMDKINNALGLPSGTSKEDVKAHIDSLGLSDKNIAARKIQELDLMGDIETGKGYEVRQTHAEIAKDLGKDGVKIYAGAVTTVTGGQGMDTLAKACGASEGVATAVDITLTVSEKQPLDLLSSHIESTVASKQKREVVIEPPSEVKDATTAKNVLKDAVDGKEVSTEDLENAGDSIGTKMAEDHKSELNTYEDYWTGGEVVSVPDKVHVQSVDTADVKSKEPIAVRDIGPSDMFVTAEDMVPEVKHNVDPSEEPTIEMDFTSVEDFEGPSDVPIDIVFCIDLTGSMADDIDAVVDSAVSMLGSVSFQTTNFRIGFVGYRDIEEDDVPFERFPFSSKPDEIQANIYALPGMVYGGGDFPESVYEGLYLANSMPWRSDASHTVILMGDAPPKTSYGGARRGGATYDNVSESEIETLRTTPMSLAYIANMSNDLSIHVYSIVVGNYGMYDEETMTAFADIANTTGGSEFKAEDANAVPSVMMDVLSEAIDQAKEEKKDTGGSGKDEGIKAQDTWMYVIALIVTAVIIIVIAVAVSMVRRSKRTPPQGPMTVQSNYMTHQTLGGDTTTPGSPPKPELPTPQPQPEQPVPPPPPSPQPEPPQTAPEHEQTQTHQIPRKSETEADVEDMWE